MLINSDLYDIDITIDGASVFEIPNGILKRAVINEAMTSPLPSCSLDFYAPTDWIDQRSIVDGSLISFSITSDTFDISEKLYFRLFDIKKLDIKQGGCEIQLTGLLDFYQGYREANEYNLYGTSSDLFKSVAKKNGLAMDIDQTNDLQLWVSGENNLYQFLSKTARFGWVDQTSAMLWWFDRRRALKYKNLTSLLKNHSNKLYKFVQSQYPDIDNREYEYTTVNANIFSGTENVLHEGYGGSDKYFDLPSYSWKSVAATKAVAESNLINLSKTHSKGLAASWYPFDMGNFHKNYWLARKQNARLLALYSTYINIRCQYLMNYQVGQIVNFELTDGRVENNEAKLASGLFFINAITINITTRTVTTNVQLAMQGLNGVALTHETY